MSPRSTGALALVALGLGAYVYFYEVRGEAERAATLGDEKKVHAGLDAEDVDVIALTTLDEIQARFERRDGVWYVVEPVEARAEGSALDAMAHALVELPREGAVEGASSLAEFGLESNAQTIRFEVEGTTRGLRVGGSTPVDGHRYVARLSDDEVAYVASYRVNAFNRNLADLRDRRIFGFEAGEVTTLRVSWPEQAKGVDSIETTAGVALARAEGGDWHLGAPLADAADEETLRDVISNLTYLRTENFVDVVDESVRAALEETALSFHWTIAGEHLERTARIAGEMDGQRLFVSADGRMDWIAATRLDDFPRRIADYRFRRLAEFEASEPRRLEMQFSERGKMGATDILNVVATLEEAGWIGTDTDGESVEPERLSALVRAMSNLTAVDIFAEEMGPLELRNLSLSPSAVTLRLIGESDGEKQGNPLAAVHIGKLYPGRGYLVRRGDSPEIFLIDAEGLTDVPISAAQYREEFRVDVERESSGDSLDERKALELP